MGGDNYFQNVNKKEIRGLKTKFKVWTEAEKTIVDKELNNLPLWLKKYKVSDILRASLQEGNPLNGFSSRKVTHKCGPKVIHLLVNKNDPDGSNCLSNLSLKILF
jgi:hypothetical protein